MKYFVGLDLSLTGSGVVVLNDAGKIVVQRLIKSKKTGERPIDEFLRILDIRERIWKAIAEINIDEEEDTVYYAIEGMAFMAKGTSLVQLSALNYLVREWINYENNQFIIVAPTSLKRFITSHGNAKKDEMMKEVEKKYGEMIMDDNIADGYSLAVVLRCLLNGAKVKNDQQQDTINLLKKQL